MAVYLVSLNRLAGARSGSNARPASESDRAATNPARPPAPTKVETQHARSAEPDSTEVGSTATGSPKARSKPAPKRGRKSSKATATARKPACTSRVGGGASTARRSKKAGSTRSGAETSVKANLPEDLACTVEELLHLPRTQVGALLEACGEPTRKVMLAMIYRLAALEDELRGVSAKVRSSGKRAVQSATFRTPSPPIADGDKTGLLEQVFQKNVSLRKQS